MIDRENGYSKDFGRGENITIKDSMKKKLLMRGLGA